MKSLLLLLTIILLSACSNNKMLEKQCLQKPKAGFCKGYFKKYYFDLKKEECSTFYWGGCGGSVPFNSLVKCKNICED